MGKVYSTQQVQIQFEYRDKYSPPETATGFRVKYRKPSGQEGYWDGAVHDANLNTITYVGTGTTTYGADGWWKFWPVALMGSDSPFIGEPIEVFIYKEGY